MSDGVRPAIFLDRDGTLIEDPGYLRDPDKVRVLPGAISALGRLRQAGFALIVVTNQAGIARGKLSRAEYDRVTAELRGQLAAGGVTLDAIYVCPHSPEIDGPCPCRKPAPGLFRQAISEHGIDPALSWWVGDRLSDIEPAKVLGGRGLLLLTGEGAAHEAGARAAGFEAVAGLPEAATRILAKPSDRH